MKEHKEHIAMAWKKKDEDRIRRLMRRSNIQPNDLLAEDKNQESWNQGEESSVIWGQMFVNIIDYVWLIAPVLQSGADLYRMCIFVNKIDYA